MNTPTLSIADNGDGTGAVASISGSSVGSTNTVYTAPWSVAGKSLVWTASGSRTGDGTLPISLANGFYAAYCESTLAGTLAPPSNMPLFTVTGGDTYTSVHKALAEAVAAKIRGMLGTDIIGPASESVRLRKTANLSDFSGINPLPANYQYSLPAIIICYLDDEEIDPNLGTNARDEIGYPITFVFAREGQAADTFSEDGDDLFLTWRQAVERTFTNLRGYSTSLTVTADGKPYTFHKCLPQGGMIYDVSRAAKKLDVGWMKFSFRVWRGPLG